MRGNAITTDPVRISVRHVRYAGSVAERLNRETPVALMCRRMPGSRDTGGRVIRGRDRPITGRLLLRYQAEPCGKVAPFRCGAPSLWMPSMRAGCSHLAWRLSGPAFACMRECAHLAKAE